MTIALLTDGIPPYINGGMQKHSFLLAEYLARNGVEVLLYHCVEPGTVPNEEEVRSHFSRQAHNHLSVRTFIYRDDGVLPGHYIRSQRELSQRYFERLKTEELDIDFIYTKGFMGWACLLNRSEFPRCGIGVKFHGMNMFQSQPDWKGELSKYLLRGPVRNIMRKADYTFSYGGKITDIIRKEVNGQTQIVEIPAGIQASSIFSGAPRARKERITRFIFVGRYDRLKGLPELYKVLSELPSDNWQFTFVGPIPEHDRLEHENCRYAGPIYDQEKLFQVLDQNDVLVCPSISEGMPNVILEAMARGLAILATDVGATSLLVQNNGLLITPKSNTALTNALLTILDMDEEAILRMKNTSLEMIKTRYNWDVISHELIRFLKGSIRA